MGGVGGRGTVGPDDPGGLLQPPWFCGCAAPFLHRRLRGWQRPVPGVPGPPGSESHSGATQQAGPRAPLRSLPAAPGTWPRAPFHQKSLRLSTSAVSDAAVISTLDSL